MLIEMPVPVLPLADILYAFKVSSFLSGKVIVFLLFTASIGAWTVMVTKIMEIRQAFDATNRFLSSFRREKHPLSLFIKRASFVGSPLVKVYESACAAISVELEEREPMSGERSFRELDTKNRLSVLQIGAIRNTAERQVADQALRLESKMGFLATAVSCSPLLGLLGTVWGVLDAFSSMAVQGMANLSAVAPGIAAALLTTVVGLLVALPSAVGYNYLASRIRELSVQMDNFTDEFMADIQRTFLRE
jgi:biopolymer transport protein ExbB/TolQ